MPRLLNIIGDRALLGGYTEDRHIVNATLVRRASAEVSGKRLLPGWLPWVAGTAAVAAVTATTWLVWLQGREAVEPPPPAAIVQPAPAAAPPAVAAPAPQPAASDVAPLLQGAAAVTDLDGAYTRLFALWNARYVAGSEAACSQALRQGLECLDEAGGLAALRRFNRPAILALEDNSGAVHQTVWRKSAPTRRSC